jgi:putative membrane protein
MWVFGKKNIIITLLLSSIVVAVFHFLEWEFIAIPFLPVASIGTAVAFYVGFKNNQPMIGSGKQEDYGEE